MNKKIIAIAVFWLLLLGVLIGTQEWTFWGAREIVVKTIPVDPNDFFRGDYVVLAYDFSRGKVPVASGSGYELSPMQQSGSVLQALPKTKNNETMYAVLKEKDGIFIFDHFSAQMPGGNEVFIKGKIQDLYDTTARVEYGIEEYFLPQGEGKVWENQRGKNLMVKLLLGKNGEARVKELFIAK